MIALSKVCRCLKRLIWNEICPDTIRRVDILSKIAHVLFRAPYGLNISTVKHEISAANLKFIEEKFFSFDRFLKQNPDYLDMDYDRVLLKRGKYLDFKNNAEDRLHLVKKLKTLLAGGRLVAYNKAT